MAVNDDIVYKIAFSRLRGMGVRLARELLDCCGSEERFFTATASELSAMMGFRSRILDDDVRDGAMRDAEREIEFVRKNGIKTLYFTHDDFPQRLLECDDAPVMLYSIGSLDYNSVSCLSVVGTRRATVYGTEFINKLVAHIAAAVCQPVAIVSGLAFGIDISAHRAALKNELPTVAVLAHGLNRIYPAEHRNYAADIVNSGGALLTEYPSIAPVHKGNFLARNRIVAGLSKTLIVAESEVKGGAMATARMAQDYGRDVYALPGRVNDRFSSGCNALIARNTAGIITGVEDLVEQLGWTMRTVEGVQQELFKDLEPLEQQVVDLLTRNGEMRLGELQIKIGENAGKLAALLVDMEFKGLVMAVPGGLYRMA